MSCRPASQFARRDQNNIGSTNPLRVAVFGVFKPDVPELHLQKPANKRVRRHKAKRTNSFQSCT